tara:strand:+ start:7456 stop:8652 length:1197 start_codon:yes stop_codon:yes gene_type:complete
MFVDNVELSLLSGAGGSGSISFKSKGTKSSPNGGTGGDGGSIYFKSDNSMYDFSSIYSTSSFKAENGQDAGKDFKDGKNGEDLFINIPLGTSIFINNEKVAEIIKDGVSFLICKGGKGGRGNKDLISKRNPNPKISESGEKRKKVNVKLQLSLITDIAILGLPNSGKSTLIKTMTNSNAKTGAYPFTTTSPNLGVYESSEKNLVICDLPGLIEGASEGIGMGDSILKHLKNSKTLILVLDPSNQEYTVDEQNKLIEKEIYKYNKDLKNLPIIKVVNKSDLGIENNKYLNISAIHNEGINELIESIEKYDYSELDTVNKSFEKISLGENLFSIERFDNRWEVTGELAEQITNLNGNDFDVFNEISYRFEKSEIPSQLEEMGIKKGDLIKLNNSEFEYEK